MIDRNAPWTPGPKPGSAFSLRRGHRTPGNNCTLQTTLNLPGASGMALGIAFAVWASRQRYGVRTEDIQSHFGVSRATSYRWRKAWEDAKLQESL